MSRILQLYRLGEALGDTHTPAVDTRLLSSGASWHVVVIGDRVQQGGIVDAGIVRRWHQCVNAWVEQHRAIARPVLECVRVRVHRVAHLGHQRVETRYRVAHDRTPPRAAVHRMVHTDAVEEVAPLHGAIVAVDDQATDNTVYICVCVCVCVYVCVSVQRNKRPGSVRTDQTQTYTRHTNTMHRHTDTRTEKTHGLAVTRVHVSERSPYLRR
jgi:hypothetical protein